MPTPLAVRRRPQKLADLKGQEHLLRPGSILYEAISSGKLFSMIFWGPPGSGKTTLAAIISQATKANFIRINAVASGLPDLKQAIAEAKKNKNSLFSTETILFIDEIHRFNKAQQDFLLPFVEHGEVILIGATTENPSFEVISALLSRTKVFTLQPLNTQHILAILKEALVEDEELKLQAVEIPENILETVAHYAFGDARYALNTLESLVQYAAQKKISITDDALKQILQQKALLYDKDGEEHYNLISALHKSLRDSDVEAAIYWLARMLEGGEDPKFLVRRLIRFASEDIGVVDPQALTLAIAVKDAVLFLGMPECNTALTQLVVYLAQAPKNNRCYVAYSAAKKDVDEFGPLPVPLHIRNAPTGLMKDLGYGKGYKYAHNFPGAKVDQEHFPAELKGRKYFDASGSKSGGQGSKEDG